MIVAEAIKRPYDNFTALRLALALAVVVSHAFSVGTGRHMDEPLHALTGYTLGEHGVNGFFAVSGFLVAMSWDRRGGALAFATARLLRVFPGLIAAVLVTALAIGGAMTTQPLASYLTDGRVWRMIWVTVTTFKSATVLPGLFESNPLRWPISTVWTLRYELFCYAGLLAYGMLGGFRRPALMLAGAVAAALALAAVAIPALAKLALPALYAPALFIGSAYLFLFVAMAPGLSRPAFEPRWDISYGVYLYGWPVQQALQALFPAVAGWLMLGPALMLACFLGAISWLAVERPALTLKSRLIGRR